MSRNAPDPAAANWDLLIRKLIEAHQSADTLAVARLLKQIGAERERELLREVADITDALRAGLDRLGRGEQLAHMARHDMPDARARLEHVLKLTEDAAHRTLDLVERSTPLAEGLRLRAAEIAKLLEELPSAELTTADRERVVHSMSDHLARTIQDCDDIRSNLTEVLVTQGYQDLSGQIIRGVISVVGELESALGDLMRISGTPTAPAAPRGSVARGFGPVVPRANDGLSSQQAVDDLIADLGI